MSSSFTNMFSASDHDDAPAKGVAGLFDRVIRATLYCLAILIPLFFLPWTSEVLEFNKQILLLVGAVVVGFAWLAKALVTKRLEYRHTIINVFVAVFVAVYGLSAAFSQNHYLSILGDNGQQKGSFITVLAFAILYFVIVNTVRSTVAVRRLLIAMVSGGFLAAVFGLFQGLGVYVLPFNFAQSSSFNTVGTSAALGIYLAFLTTVSGGLMLAPHGSYGSAKWSKFTSLCLLIVSVLSVFMVAVIEFFPVLVSLMVGAAILIAFAIAHARSVRGITGILLPVLAFVVCGLVLIFGFPINLKYPAEVMPSISASAKIAMETLQTNPLLGSGPGTFVSDYAQYHSADVNNSQFWNVRFDRSATRFYTLVATTGLFGGLSYIMLLLVVLLVAGRKLAQGNEDTWHVLVGVFAAWACLVAARFVYSSSFVLEFGFWMSLALLAATLARDERTVQFEDSPRSGMSASFILIIGVVATLSGLYVFGQRYAADKAYARVLKGGMDSKTAVENLAIAARKNQYNDGYLRNFAIIKLTQVSEILSVPALKKEAQETDQQFKDRQAADQQKRVQEAGAAANDAILLARRATEVAPSMVTNWATLGYVYQSLIALTPNAADFAIAAYTKASELEPVNPTLYTELGKIVLAQSDTVRLQADSKDEAVKKAAVQKADELTLKALEYFNKAIALKSDYAAAHFQIAIAFERQGKLKEAIAKMESVVAYNQKEVGVGFQLSLLYWRDGRKDAALRLMESVVRLSPNYSDARWFLAAMLEENGNLDGAIEQLTEVVKLNPDNAGVQQRLDAVKAKKAAGTAPAPAALPQPVEDAAKPPAPAPVKK